jgi:hypothetical protein
MDNRDESEQELIDGIQSTFWKFPRRIQHLIDRTSYIQIKQS